MKNKLTDLNDHLFMQMERLNDETLTAEQIDAEKNRAGSMVQVADQIIENAKLQLSAAKLVVEYGNEARQMMPTVVPAISYEKKFS